MLSFNTKIGSIELFLGEIGLQIIQLIINNTNTFFIISQPPVTLIY